MTQPFACGTAFAVSVLNSLMSTISLDSLMSTISLSDALLLSYLLSTISDWLELLNFKGQATFRIKTLIASLELQSSSSLMTSRIMSSISFVSSFPSDLEHIILGSRLQAVETLFPECYTDIAIACFDNC